jgi:hypothetical protein
VTDFVADFRPSVLKQVRVNVVVPQMMPLSCVPDAAFMPVQPPLALHHAAFVADHVRVVCWPGATFAFLLENEMVGVRGRTGPHPSVVLLHGCSTHDAFL